jgi:hypothetical protein
VINQPGNVCFRELSLTPKDLHRLPGSNPPNVINDCQSLIKRQDWQVSAHARTCERLAEADRDGYGSNMTVKEQVLLAIERLPEDADFKDVKDEIALLAALREAEDDIAAGRTVTNEEMRRRIGAWTGA